MPVKTSLDHLWDDEDGTHIFQVHDTLFKLDSRLLRRKSTVIKDLLEQAQPSFGIGGALMPIPMTNCTVATFELFAEAALSMRKRKISPPVEQWVDVLEFANFLLAQDMKDYAIGKIHAGRFGLTGITLIELCHKYHSRRLFRTGFEILMWTPLDLLSNDDIVKLGGDVFISIARAQARTRTLLHILACEPPSISHTASCTSPVLCNDSWDQAYWNGMGRLLLDGRNSYRYHDAIDKFMVSNFGNMNEECKVDAITQLKNGADYVPMTVYIRAQAEEVSNKLIVELDGSE